MKSHISLSFWFVSLLAASLMRGSSARISKVHHLSRKPSSVVLCRESDGSSCKNAKLGDSSQPDYRPDIHYTPSKGFLNDPSGLVKIKNTYHMFYQCNPNDTERGGDVYWGHAVSCNLINWKTLDIALYPNSDGNAFTGSCVALDDNRMAALYTRGFQGAKQAQELATSTDGGRTFSLYEHNPVIDRNNNEFRDPQVFWHPSTNEWKMAVVLARDFMVLFYSSPDLKDWRQVGSFGPAAHKGGAWECPNLFEVPIEGGGSKWVLFISLDSGMPLGGSGIQSFIGEFDGWTFTPDTYTTEIVDYGKDFYAFQVYSNVGQPEGPMGFAWMSNWQYSTKTPTGEFRGVMSLPRKYSLRDTDSGLQLVQAPVGLEALTQVPISPDASSEDRVEYFLPDDTKAFLFNFTYSGKSDSVATFTLMNAERERVDIGYDVTAHHVFVDRSHTQSLGPLYTGQMAALVTRGIPALDISCIYDRITLECFIERGQKAISAVLFTSNPLNVLYASITGEGEFLDVTVKALYKNEQYPPCE